MARIGRPVPAHGPDARAAARDIVRRLIGANQELQRAQLELQTLNQSCRARSAELEASTQDLRASHQQLVDANDRLSENAFNLRSPGDDVRNLLAMLRNPVLFVGPDGL